MKKLHLAGTILGLVGCTMLLTIACSSSNNTTGGHHTGGRTGSGGSGIGGASNHGGNSNVGGAHSGGVPSACASTAIVDSTDTLVADFECLPGPNAQKFDWFPWPNWDSWQHGAYWYYDGASQFDATYQNWSCIPQARGGLFAGGHASTTAGYVEADVPKTSWGAGFGIWMGGSSTTPDTDTVVSCIDVSAFTGVSFWLKGENTGTDPAGGYIMQLKTFDTTAAYPATPVTCPADGGKCAGTKNGGCTAATCDPYTYAGTIPAAWTQVTVKWTDLVAPTTGVTAAFDPHKLTSINFAMDASKHGGTVQFYIDDIEWVGGGPSILPRTCPAAAGGAPAGGAPNYTTWQQAGAGGLASLPKCDGTPSAGGAGP